MSKAFKGTLLILGIFFIGASFLWLASFLFRVFMSGGEAGLLRSAFTGTFALTDQIRSLPWDIIYYQRDYGELFDKPLRGAWWISGLVHFGLILLIGKILSKTPSLYGDARFASFREVAKANLLIKPSEVKKGGLFAGTKIIVGRLGKNYIGLGGQLFAYLAAPTRSGKGVGVVIPVGLSYAHSMVVSDIKQELFELTAAYRAQNGHKVYLFNPFDADGRTARWNPLSYVSRSEQQRVDDLNQIAICLIPDAGEDSFFVDSARKLFIGLGLYCLDKERHYQSQGAEFVPTIKAILDLSTDFSGEAVPYFSSLMGDEFLSVVATQTINSAVSSGNKTFASILATLTANLTLWLSEPVVNATSGDDFDLRSVRKELITIYLGIQPKDLQKAGKLINLFYSQLINENTSVLPQNDPSLKYQCLMLMDEGTAAGRIAILEKAVSYMAGYNLRLLFIAQSPAQLEDRKLYGETGTRNILTNIALKVLYKPNDIKDSEEYSRLLGKVTVKQDTSKSRGGGRGGASVTETQNQRDLMLPQELRAMDADKEIIIFEGISYPIMAQKNRYYDDPVFVSRYKNQGVALVRPIKERLSKAEKVGAMATAALREGERKYKKILQQHINERVVSLKTETVINFCSALFEQCSSEAVSIQAGTA